MIKRILGTVVVLMILTCFSCVTNNQPEPVSKIEGAGLSDETPETETFTLGPGDEIVVNVWRNDDLGRTVTIDSSGKIRLPLVGEIKASGLTAAQLNEQITSRLSTYITNPFVDVNIVSINSRKVHVMGEVRSPGSFTYERRIPVWEAVAKAGGFTDDANKKKLLLVEVENGEAQLTILTLDFEEMVEKGAIKKAYYLKNGAILYIPETRIASIEEFMVRLNNIVSPIHTIQKMITITPNVIDAISGEDTRILVN